MAVQTAEKGTGAPGTPELDAAAVKSMVGSGGALLVDVREPDENARERIPGAHLLPLSRFDPARVPAGGAVVFHCKGGRRSLDALRMFRGASGREAYSLRGGIEAWKKAGLPVEANTRVPISIMRQVQITAGGLVLAGVVLGVTVSPWFLGLSGFVGAGLVFAGASGLCGMAALLGVMPWNRVSGGGGAAC